MTPERIKLKLKLKQQKVADLKKYQKDIEEMKSQSTILEKTFDQEIYRTNREITRLGIQINNLKRLGNK